MESSAEIPSPTSYWYLIVKDVRYSKAIWQEAGRTGLIQSGEEAALENLMATFQCVKEVIKKTEP